MQEVWVVVDCRSDCEDPDGAAGVWSVSLDEDLEPGQAAGAALDVFHNKVAISELDDFEISVHDPVTREFVPESDDYVQGSGCLGGVELIAASLQQLA